MKNVLFSLILLIICIPSSAAEQVDSTLIYYSRRGMDCVSEPKALLIADTLLQLARKKDNARMQAVAMSLKADHYFRNNNLDSLKAWIPRVQTFARQNDKIYYYYFVWARLILYYINHSQYTLAQYELEHYLAQAKIDDYKPAIADSYIHLAYVYSDNQLTAAAVEYYRRGIEYIEQNDLDKLSLSLYYRGLASELISLKEYEQAAEAIEKGKKSITRPEHIWILYHTEVSLLLNTGQQEKAEQLLQKIIDNNKDYIPALLIYEIQASVYLKGKKPDKALAALELQEAENKQTGNNEQDYYGLFSAKADAYALREEYKQAYENLEHYADLYQQKVSKEGTSSLKEFATLLDVTRLDQEKLQLQQQTQNERLQRNRSVIFGLAAILILATAFIILQIRTNRHLSRAKRAAEEANRMKGVFIRTITHEINTPLNAIVGFSELVATTPANDPERHTYINIIHENTDYLQKLVDDVLYISDIESSAVFPVFTEVDVNACCTQCLATMRNARTTTGIEFRFSPGCENLTIRTSVIHLIKVLNELLLNASRFAPTGIVTLTYQVTPDRANITFTVTDTGPGVSATEADRIFERFVKLNPFNQGLGLGLSVCKLIAHTMQGEIRLDTSYSKGARFHFTIPI